MKGITLAQLQASGLPLEVHGPPAVQLPEVRYGKPEEQFKETVLQFAQENGWLRAHFRPARTNKGWRTPVEADGKGFLDLVLVRERVVWAELKAPGKKMSADQMLWFNALKAAKQEVYVWWPKDWPNIKSTLR